MLQGERISLKTIFQVKKYEYPTDGSCPWAVYLHVICNQNGTTGTYAGQSQLLERRIREHTRERSQFQQRIEAERNIGQHEKLPSSHIAFWVLRGMNDMWLKFAQLPRQPATEIEKDRQQLLLTILEEYAVLIFRTLPPSELAWRLPPDCKVQPYPWAGLNICDPLDQLINGPRSYAKSSRNSKMGRLGLHLYEEFWRHVDISKGDPDTIPIVCGECRDASTGRLDEEPLFEVSSGAYLAMSKHCSKCSRRRIHVPRDQSRSWMTFDSAKRAYLRSRSQPPADVVDFTIMASYELALWIQSHGIQAMPSERKYNLSARAEDIRRSLLGAQHAKQTLINGNEENKAAGSERDHKVLLPQWMLKGSWRQ
ncbi:hypothetical protein CNYM01_02609 [Colletotrichum nymphaeae SA-01]|uniref:GIY-YIG domain-containing protein n=1 Tax=Colletotrichum nymphaeae SA-01 TaxID=1460502 RepID=A0A135SZW4_9PEZI|nr:hypothetical protein CNYM01_02609 [Colletotrichum nymphaeae SA-01]